MGRTNIPLWGAVVAVVGCGTPERNTRGGPVTTGGSGNGSSGNPSGGDATGDDSGSDGHGGDSDSNGGDDPGSGSGGENTGGSTSSGGSGEGTDDSGGDVRFDIGEGSGPGSGGEGGSRVCRKVDLLLAVDNSSSMQEEISALAGPVFDSFPQQLLAVGNGLEDFHLAVKDGCTGPAVFHDRGRSGPCNFSTGKNWMVSTSPTLADEYSCVTDLWASCGEDDEQPANAAADAISTPYITGQNADFLRDDAVLFIVAITDEDEQPVPARSAQAIADRIIAAKNGAIENIVFLGIGGSDGGMPGGPTCPPVCIGGSACSGPYGSASDASTLRQVADVFERAGRGLFWNLCDGNLEQAFAAAIELVDGACEDFDPVG